MLDSQSRGAIVTGDPARSPGRSPPWFASSSLPPPNCAWRKPAHSFVRISVNPISCSWRLRAAQPTTSRVRSPSSRARRSACIASASPSSPRGLRRQCSPSTPIARDLSRVRSGRRACDVRIRSRRRAHVLCAGRADARLPARARADAAGAAPRACRLRPHSLGCRSAVPISPCCWTASSASSAPPPRPIARRSSIRRRPLLPIGARRVSWLGLRWCLLDVPIDSAAEFEFIRALIAASPHDVITVPFGDIAGARSPRRRSGSSAEVLEQKGDADLAALRRYLFATAAAHQNASPRGDVDCFSAPGEGRECVEIARRILRGGARGRAVRRDGGVRPLAAAIRGPARARVHARRHSRAGSIAARAGRIPPAARSSRSSPARSRSCRRAGSPNTSRSRRCRSSTRPAPRVRLRGAGRRGVGGCREVRHGARPVSRSDGRRRECPRRPCPIAGAGLGDDETPSSPDRCARRGNGKR